MLDSKYAMQVLRSVLILPAFGLVAAAQIYVSPSGDDANPATEARPIRTLVHARDLVRARNGQMTADLTVYLSPGPYRLSEPLVLDARDSGSGGHNVIYSAVAPEQVPIVSGAIRVTGWKLMDRTRNLWSAPAPAELKNSRQLYVDGVRAARARGRLPVTVSVTENGYTANSQVMAHWSNPSDIEFVYTGGNSIWSEHGQGLGSWTEPRCPVASISGASIVMAQPCWNNSTKRIMLPPPATRTVNLVGPASVGKQPAYVENAFELLGTPGQWYFDRTARVVYYVPRTGENLEQADVEVPVLETLVSAAGTASAPIHNIVFSGIQFSYATWLRPSTSEGFSEIQANYTLTGPKGWATQGLCQLAPNGDCPYGAWTKMPANVALQYSHDISFRGDAFLHLGAGGLDLGDGAQGDSVEGCAFTDISGNGVELGAVDKPLATGPDITRDNRIRNNHIWNIGAEYRGGIGIVVGYAQRTAVEHNQNYHTPYAAISMGWGGWPDKIQKAGQSNYSENNRVADNRIFNFMLVLADGGGIYTQGLTGPDLKNGERVTGNVVTEQFGSGHGIYTDNGSCNITVARNVMFHTNFDNWGSRHKNYYNGADGSANDPLDILDNYWQQGGAEGSSGNVTLRGNRLISSLDQVPQAILDSAGLEPAFRGLLTRRLEKPSAPDPPSRVAVTAAGDVALVTWNPPVFEGGSPIESYMVTGSNGTKSVISAADFWSIGYVKVGGLAVGGEYTFTVTAINANGTSPASMPSVPVRLSGKPVEKPAPPVNVRVFADSNGVVSVHLQDPAAVDKKAPGAPIIGYTITAKPGGQKIMFTGRNVLALAGTTHTTFTVLNGLRTGETYTFSVAAINPAGEGLPAQSNAVKIPAP
jgi:hypothetical protein